MKNEVDTQREEYFILEEECDAETMRTALINSNEQFSVDDITIALKGNYIYSAIDGINTCMKYEDIKETNAVFLIMKNKLKTR